MATTEQRLAGALRAVIDTAPGGVRANEADNIAAKRDSILALAAYDAQQAVTPSDSGPFVGGLHIELFGEDESPDADAHGYALQSNGTRICDGLEEDHARRIVQCVNAHDALVSALQSCQRVLDDNGGTTPQQWIDAEAAARDALAAAGVTP